MKRRVLTSKANKKALRQVLAANSGSCTGMKAPYNVLVDTSFVRMAATANSGLTAPLNAHLKDRAFGEDARMFYHPSTYNKVKRTCPEALDILTAESSDVTRVRFPNAAADAPTYSKEREEGRSELKAITEFITRQRAVDKRLWFVATVNHDMKNTVGAITPTVRLSVKPTGMWIEPQTGGPAVMPETTATEEAQEEGSAAGVSSFKRGKRNRGGQSEGEEGASQADDSAAPTEFQSMRKKAPGRHQKKEPVAAPAPARVVERQLAVPKKDAAFMRKLGIKPPTTATVVGGGDPSFSKTDSTRNPKFKAKTNGDFKRRTIQAANPMASKKRKQKLRLVSE